MTVGTSMGKRVNCRNCSVAACCVTTSRRHMCLGDFSTGPPSEKELSVILITEEAKGAAFIKEETTLR